MISQQEVEDASKEDWVKGMHSVNKCNYEDMAN